MDTTFLKIVMCVKNVKARVAGAERSHTGKLTGERFFLPVLFE